MELKEDVLYGLHPASPTRIRYMELKDPTFVVLHMGAELWRIRYMELKDHTLLGLLVYHMLESVTWS